MHRMPTNLQFTNRYTQLPADPETGSARRQIKGACYSRVQPTAAPAPQLIAHASEVAELLGIDLATWGEERFVDVFVGNRMLPDMDAHATCYGGHQFGNWAGQLGDGRAINLGEILAPDGAHYMLQLKGAGPTPYSRTADGYAVLRSSVREFLCSEAMHHLGVPTTRALSLITTGAAVVRDMLYDGNPAPEPGAVVCRVAPSFTRFGHFEMLAARGETELLRRFVEYTMRNDFPELLAQPDAAIDAADILAWFDVVCERTAVMIAHWMRVGFVHGVMNTDNMSILGQTIDYGPYGWLEDYDPNWTPNTTDAGQRRYRYGQQPAIAHWNLLQLANAIYAVVPDAPALEGMLNAYPQRYTQTWHTQAAAKLGFTDLTANGDEALWQRLTELLQMRETDMTRFFRALAHVDSTSEQHQLTLFDECYYQPPGGADEAAVTAQQTALGAWLQDYQASTRRANLPARLRRERMQQANPKYVLRNYLAQLAIDRAEQGDPTGVSELLELLRQPYAEQPDKEEFAALRPDWARTRVGCSQLSCSS